jgi:predicted RNA-binding protein with PUA-like domain
VKWLVKSEPGTYSFSDLVRDGSTCWDGVSNPVALKHLRAMKKGDQVLFYHTGTEKAVVGLARVSGNPYPDPRLEDPKRVVVDLAAVRPLGQAVSLAAIKADSRFKNLGLVRIGRLSVMPVSAGEWQALLDLSRAGIPNKTR